MLKSGMLAFGGLCGATIAIYFSGFFSSETALFFSGLLVGASVVQLIHSMNLTKISEIPTEANIPLPRPTNNKTSYKGVRVIGRQK